VILNNEFKEYQKIVEEIDKIMYFVNLDIRKGLCPHNECGIIYIDSKGSQEYFASELTHEAGHICFDPVTTINYIECAYEIKKALSKDYNIDEETLRILTNISSDIINEWNISKSKKLSEFLSIPSMGFNQNARVCGLCMYPYFQFPLWGSL
jgi:hypothetical protein